MLQEGNGWRGRELMFVVPLVLLGAAFRAKMFFSDRSLWLDEAMLALNLQARSFAGLLKPLDYDQAAPIGFLWLVKAAMRLFGDGERAMRAGSFVAGLSSLPLFWVVVRRWVATAGAVVALLLFAISPNLIYYSAEVKQYGLEVTIALLIVWLTQRMLEMPSVGRCAALLMTGMIAVWFSNTAVFVLAAALAALAIKKWEGRGRWTTGMTAAWGLSFGIEYLWLLRPVAHSGMMKMYWSAGLMPWSVGAGAKFLLRIIVEVFNNAVGCSVPAAMLVAFAAGCIAMALRGKRVLILAVGPVALVFAASILRLYPFTARLVLLAVPLMIATVAAGIEFIWSDRSARRWVAPVMLVLIVAYMGRDAVASLSKATLGVPARQEMKPVLAFVKAHLEAGDRIMLYPSARAAFTFYAPQFGLEIVPTATFGDVPIRGFTQGWTENHSWESLANEAAKLKGTGRVWVIMSHIKVDGGVDEAQLFRFILDRDAQHLATVGSVDAGAVGYLYDFGR